MERTPASLGARSPWSEACSHKPLAEAYFDLPMPKGTKVNASPTTRLQLIYNQCYWLSFGRNSSPERLVDTKVHAKIVAAFQGLDDKDIRQFMLANMWSHRESGIGYRFKAESLCTPGANNRFKLYSKAAAVEWGHVDIDSIDRFFNEEKTATILADSEMLAARWFIGYKISRPGDAIKAMYDALECKLNPLWLALEPTYLARIGGTSIEMPDITADSKEVWQVRLQVAKWQVAFNSKQSKNATRSWIQMRSSAATSIIPGLMSTFGQSVSDYTVCKLKWDSTFDLWTKISLAFRQVAVWSMYSGAPTPLSKWLNKNSVVNINSF